MHNESSRSFLTIEACAFDIDGTLYPEWKFYVLVFPFMLKNIALMNAFKQVRKDIRQYQKEHPKVILDFFDFQAEMLSKLLKKDKELIKEEVNKKIYTGWKPLFRKIRPYENAKETIVALKSMGIRIGLLSDFLVEQKEDVWGILPHCDASISAESVGALKPSPHPFVALAKKLNVEPEKILYVGNNIKYDVMGARSVGMKTALISSRFFKKKCKEVDIIFSNYRQLLEALLWQFKVET